MIRRVGPVAGFLWLAALQMLAACAMIEQQPAPVGATWLVEDVGGLGMIDRTQSTIRFEDEGRVYGSSGCNQFSGGARIHGDALSFGRLATTRRSCAPALMAQEDRLLSALDAVNSYRLYGESLVLSNAAGTVLLRLSRLN